MPSNPTVLVCVGFPRDKVIAPSSLRFRIPNLICDSRVTRSATAIIQCGDLGGTARECKGYNYLNKQYGSFWGRSSCNPYRLESHPPTGPDGENGRSLSFRALASDRGLLSTYWSGRFVSISTEWLDLGLCSGWFSLSLSPPPVPNGSQYVFVICLVLCWSLSRTVLVRVGFPRDSLSLIIKPEPGEQERKSHNKASGEYLAINDLLPPRSFPHSSQSFPSSCGWVTHHLQFRIVCNLQSGNRNFVLFE